MDQAPPELARLQIRSSPLDDAPIVDALPEIAHGAMVVAVTPQVAMSWGKQAAQTAHAGQRAWMTASADELAAWETSGRDLRIIHPTAELWAAVAAQATTQIHDGGFTEIPAGTNTTVAWFVGGSGQHL